MHLTEQRHKTQHQHMLSTCSTSVATKQPVPASKQKPPQPPRAVLYHPVDGGRRLPLVLPAHPQGPQQGSGGVDRHGPTEKVLAGPPSHVAGVLGRDGFRKPLGQEVAGEEVLGSVAVGDAFVGDVKRLIVHVGEGARAVQSTAALGHLHAHDVGVVAMRICQRVERGPNTQVWYLPRRRCA